MKLRFATFRSAFANLRIRSKVLVLVFIVMAVSSLTAFILQQYAYSTYDEQLYEKSSQVLNMYASGIEDELKQIESMTFSVLANSKVQEYLGEMSKLDVSAYERLVAQSKLIDTLVGYTGSERYIQSLILLDTHHLLSSAGLVTMMSADRIDEIRKRAAEAKGELVWIYPDSADRALIAARQIRSYENLQLEVLGTLIVRVNLEKIVDDYILRADSGKGALMIMAGNRRIYPMEGGEARHLPFEMPESLNLPEQDGYRIVDWEGDRLFVTRMQSKLTSWGYFQLIPFNDIFDRIVWMKRVLVAFFALSLVVIVAVALRFSAGITKPIEELIGRMKRVQMGDFRLEAHELAASGPPGADEVGQLHRTFRMMLQQIDELITENYAKQLTIKETQFRALQAQINPHFLYNTLESINWLAKANGQQQISQMVEALGFLLRSSISMSKPLIPLREELEIVRHYITIQKFRFEERLDFRLNVPDGYGDCLIPKLSLQPLLENAIHYALEPKVEPCRIGISLRADGDDLRIAVEDEGPGMSADVLEKIRQGQVRTRGTGIGLLNIDERIKLAFGEAYGLIIESSIGGGTRVILHVPRREAGEEH
ncbi:sensor histidine kinase [Paenibacillus thermoaerophilus]|uniref:histidine kinase n=1 Tax=Paenibacillus thermoaerophilus TaxID=1215385 RepID=A0ABW2V0N8_9BACL|nr:sensor histidine kinase [Paenibacillus thermoaerophilus]